MLRLQTNEESVYLGQTIAGRFRVEQRLGVGSFGIVYRGTDQTQSCKVAIKTIRATHDETEQLARALLVQEADAIAKVQVSGIPRLIDFVENCDGRPILVLEFIDGRTLRDLVKFGPLAPERAAKIVAKIAGILQLAHRSGSIHRDLSSSNVIIDDNDCPILLDFGLSVSQIEQFDRYGERAGTPGYMPFESAMGITEDLDGRSDLWGLGVILFELLTGRLPLRPDGSNTALVSALHIDTEMKSLTGSVPPLLLSICQKCVALSAYNRFDTASELMVALQSYLNADLPLANDARVEMANFDLMVWRRVRWTPRAGPQKGWYLLLGVWDKQNLSPPRLQFRT